ncbi:MAG: hypothetical protein AAFR53_01885 [Pseudomonadota bacterium]
MSSLDVPAGEEGRIRVFALSMTDSEAKALSQDAGAKAVALGVPDIEADYVEVFPVKNLEGLGLAGYLVEGHAAVEEDVNRDKSKLGALGGWVMVVMSKAFRRQVLELDPDPRLTLIGYYRQEGIDWTPVPVTSSTAEPDMDGDGARKPMSDARISGMVATAVLLFLAVFVTIFILLAG